VAAIIFLYTIEFPMVYADKALNNQPAIATLIVLYCFFSFICQASEIFHLHV